MDGIDEGSFDDGIDEGSFDEEYFIYLRDFISYLREEIQELAMNITAEISNILPLIENPFDIRCTTVKAVNECWALARAELLPTLSNMADNLVEFIIDLTAESGEDGHEGIANAHEFSECVDRMSDSFNWKEKDMDVVSSVRRKKDDLLRLLFFVKDDVPTSLPLLINHFLQPAYAPVRS